MCGMATLSGTCTATNDLLQENINGIPVIKTDTMDHIVTKIVRIVYIKKEVE